MSDASKRLATYMMLGAGVLAEHVGGCNSRCDRDAHYLLPRCECPARDEGATAYHWGNPDGCPRDAADHGPNVRTDPELCMACIYGCAL